MLILRPKPVVLISALAGLVAGCAQSTWPQWGGPQRNFKVPAARLAEKWPADGPRKLWSRPLGDGFATIVGDGSTLYTLYRKDKDDPNESIIALSAATGETAWEHKYPAAYIVLDEKDDEKKQTTEFGCGPNATPVLAGGRLFTIGFTGIMHCLDAKTGKPLWSHDLFKDYGGALQVFGYSASPIAYGDTIIALVGGKDRSVMAFDQATGAVRWQSGDFGCSYSSPILASIDGVDHLVAYLGTTIVGMSPRDGKIEWSLAHKNPSNNNSICSPIACPGNRIYFVNFGDTAGGKLIKLARRDGRIQPDEVWANKKLQGGMSDVIQVGDHFYGANGQSFVIAFNAASGQIEWQERGYPRAKVVHADGKLLLLDDDGRLSLLTPTPGGLVQHAKAQLLEKPAWSAPTLIGSRLYLRDRKTIMAVDLG